ncbi:type II toxin-antitoxin system HicB family antitoxin [Thiospirillum jenense]|uniref:Type II toxin-antitoxin system HicB family antitoxin n=1 Tax=Thiospirillum jenense TaxID=1653858 RepID=A0A839HB27_9GAMM|nr:type II toxin-antitoxin system HicB family antitoxin [Thiospirillum jenense]MBB1126245.1 type II toxin-antitoxin system HicB family antitoxin [Thiospirillum jenense]
MFFPIYIHKDADSAYGMTFPDFPGCFSAADQFADIPRMAQEAIELYYEGESVSMPPPSTPEQWIGDERFQDGYWMLININLSQVESTSIQLEITLPESLVQEIDLYIAAHGKSRAVFLAQAAERAMRETRLGS